LWWLGYQAGEERATDISQIALRLAMVKGHKDFSHIVSRKAKI
jgi:hypothetical protein